MTHRAAAGKAALHAHRRGLKLEVIVITLVHLRLVQAIRWSLIGCHRILRAHLENALVLHDFIYERAIVFKVVNVVVLELVEER